MSRRKTSSRKRRQRRETLAEIPFRELVKKDAELKKLRAQYADLPAEQLSAPERSRLQPVPGGPI